MSNNRLNINQWLSRILLIAIIAVSAVVMYAINEIDKIVNTQLYGYQLQFSLDWANPYWSFTRIIYISLGATIIMTTIILLLGFIKTKKATQTLTTLKPEPTIQKMAPAPQPVYTQPPPKAKVAQAKPQTATTTTITTEEPKTKTTDKQTPAQVPTGVCPSCKKTFGQPLVMLDFEGGKSKLVNVCPYCNQVLGDTEQKIE
jgi:uncharacterized Zn-finger protein